ncbi:hypothetical protein [Mucilaginibacter aquatilis]|uniref:Uncharacterized protein n=1 Tax=Mucilaginibacter aquatilis TaxID=1517760 RepID=A0A6I4IQH3_9SPHI|nr:hypothetical protein [Mucilaginibacter aquatilis]MVN91144.1 hypothetical protein [Mucilaginibacter aquatilis]
MKYLLLVAVTLLIYGCKRDGLMNELPVKDTRQAVTFEVSGVSFFNTTPTAGTAQKQIRGYDDSFYVKYKIEDFIYLIFDSKGNLVSRYQQTSGLDADTLFKILNNDKQQIKAPFEFGKLTDSLMAGEYTLLMVGCPKYLMYNKDVPCLGNQDRFPPFPLAQTLINYPSAQIVRPIYAYKSKFTVGNGALTISAPLNRIGGDLQIVLEDAMPNNAKMITATVNFEYTGYNFGTGLPAVNSEPVVFGSDVNPENYGKRAFTFSHYLLNTATPFDVTLICYGDTNQIISTKRITGVRVGLNTTKVLYTKLFD